MRDTLFKYYVTLGNDLCYYRHYLISARRINNIYSGFLMLASAGGIVTLSCWDKVPLLWISITIAAQILQVLRPLTQAAKQQNALRYIIQDISSLFDEVCAYWDSIGAYDLSEEDELKIVPQITAWKKRHHEILNRFASDIDFPFKEKLDQKAKPDNIRYFKYHYGDEIKGE